VLVEDLVCALPPEQTVVELLETIEPDGEVVRACRRLKDRGYRLALDDFDAPERMGPLLELADVVKLDFRALHPDARRRLQAGLRRDGLTLLAEKVETPEEHAAALADGFQLFQGFWYQRPQMLSAKDVPSSRLSRLKLLQALNQPDLDFNQLEDVLKTDVSLSVKLLRYLNSAAFGFRGGIRSIRHALVLLGERPLRRWATLITLADLGEAHPPALLHSCLLRAHFCEALAPEVAPATPALEFFLSGLLSCVDALMGRPMGELVHQLALPGSVKAALEGHREGQPGRTLDLALACEAGDWGRAEAAEQALGLASDTARDAWLAAQAFADETMAQLFH